MDKLVKYGLVGVGLAGIYYLFQKSRQDGKSMGETAAELAEEVGAPPITNPGQQPVKYSIESGEGKAQIDRVVKQLAADPERGRAILAQTSQNLFSGMKFGSDMRSWAAELFGSAQDVPVFSSFTNPDYKPFLEALRQVGYRKLAQERGREGASAVVKPLMQYRDKFTFWGPEHVNGLSFAREQERFNEPGASSASRTNEMSNFVEDTQVLAKNIIEKQRQFDQALRNRAIELSRQQGWRFIETDPN